MSEEWRLGTWAAGRPSDASFEANTMSQRKGKTMNEELLSQYDDISNTMDDTGTCRCLTM